MNEMNFIEESEIVALGENWIVKQFDFYKNWYFLKFEKMSWWCASFLKVSVLVSQLIL